MSARGKARRRAVETLFEAEQRGMNAGLLIAERSAAGEVNNPYTTDAVQGVVAHWTAIDDALQTYSHGWPLTRMPAVDRAILRLGTWELVWNDEVPDGVAIAEAVELARELSTEDSPGFVNGLLGRLAQVKPTLV